MPELAAFQDAFAAALAGDGRALAPWADADAPGLMVHRNTGLKGAVDALEANFPTVARLVGPEWFRAAAREFALEHPPRAAALHAYGDRFAEWLAAFPPAAALPYLPAVAAFDRLWLEAFFAADARPLEAPELGRLDGAGLETTHARLHPSARLAWSRDNSPSLWLAARRASEAEAGMAFAPRPEGLVVCRPHEAVGARIIGAAEFAFLDACRAGRSLAEAAQAALAVPGGADLAAIVAAALEDGLFVALEAVA